MFSDNFDAFLLAITYYKNLESVKVRIVGDYNRPWDWSCPQRIQAKFQSDQHPRDKMQLMTVVTPFPKEYYQGISILEYLIPIGVKTFQ